MRARAFRPVPRHKADKGRLKAPTVLSSSAWLFPGKLVRAQQSEPRLPGKTSPKTQAKRREPLRLDRAMGVCLQQRNALLDDISHEWDG
jgi:hypothetical protein